MMNLFDKARTTALHAGCALLIGASLPGSAPAQDAAETAAISFPPESILFETADRTWTVDEFEDYARLIPPAPLRDRVAISLDLDMWPEEAVREGVREVVTTMAAAARAHEEGVSLSPEREAQLQRDLESIANRVWLIEAGVLDDRSIPDEAIAAYHQEHLADQFTTHEHLSLRHIYLGTYETYIVEEGDSLESIAEKITGDADAAERILDAESKKPRIEGTINAEGDEIAPQALAAGETLLVPMGPDANAAVEERAREAWQRLEDGENFEAVARDVSENETPGRLISIRPAKDDKPINDELRAAFLALENGAWSEPFRTRHGWQIVKRERYTPETITPVERVEARIRNTLISDGRRERYDALMREALAEYTGIAIDAEALAAAEDPSMADEVIFQLGDVKYTGANFARDFGDRVTPETPADERRALLAETSVLQRALGEWDRARRNIADTDLYKQAAKCVGDIYYANQWLDDTVQNAELEIPEESVAAKYEELRDMLKTLPAADISRITIYPEIGADASAVDFQEAMAQASHTLRAELQRVSDSAGFATLAKQISEDELAEVGGRVGEVDANHLNGIVGRAIREGGAQSFFGPFDTPDGKGVMAIWLNGVSEAQQQSMEDAREQLEEAVLRDLRRDYALRLREEIVEEAKLVVHVPPLEP